MSLYFSDGTSQKKAAFCQSVSEVDYDLLFQNSTPDKILNVTHDAITSTFNFRYYSYIHQSPLQYKPIVTFSYRDPVNGSNFITLSDLSIATINDLYNTPTYTRTTCTFSGTHPTNPTSVVRVYPPIGKTIEDLLCCHATLVKCEFNTYPAFGFDFDAYPALAGFIVVRGYGLNYSRNFVVAVYAMWA